MAIALSPRRPRARDASDYDRHVVFDNSVAPDAYYWGSGSLVAPSSLALAGGKVPVDAGPCVSPPELPAAVVAVQARRRLARDAGPQEALGRPRLRRRLALVLGVRRAGNPRRRLAAGLRHRSDEAKAAPRSASSAIGRRCRRGRGRASASPSDRSSASSSRRATSASIRGAWRASRSSRASTTTSRARCASTRSGSTTRRPQPTPPRPPRPATPAARGFDRHVELTWPASADADLLHYRIYRADDGRTFVPIGIQKAGRQRYVDFLGASGRAASYRLTAVDASDNESAAVARRAGRHARALRRRAADDGAGGELPLLLGRRASECRHGARDPARRRAPRRARRLRLRHHGPASSGPSAAS